MSQNNGSAQKGPRKQISFIADISRHGCGNGIILVGIEEGCSKEDFTRLMILANKEGHVNVTIQERV